MTMPPELHTFNVETMSGVFPGTRTAVFQRVRLVPVPPEGEPTWAQLLWTDDPPACVVHLVDSVASGADRAHLFAIADPLTGDFNQRFSAALAEAGWTLDACGSCRNWSATASQTDDGLPVGSCTLVHNDDGAVPHRLSTQSHLALACAHHTLSQHSASQSPFSTSGLRAEDHQSRLPKIAEISDSKKSPWKRARIRIGQALSRPAPPLTLEQSLAERSGVGAGTEPCFVCQGRIANLGALAVETPEGDKQTFSVWRCRLCFTLYLSNWIDRWERVESLETEETIYRIAPFEAAQLLTLFSAVRGGDHPARRRDRNAQRAAILDFVGERRPLSHVVKQGR
jgi:hypothetical protein